MSRNVVLGTHNQGKVREFQALLESAEVILLSWEDVDEAISVVEDGETFLENAFKKAEATAQITGMLAIADDSGLEVDYLNGRPGVFSARYAGPKATDQGNYAKILEELRGVPSAQRGARFVCAIALCTPDGKREWVEGECRGVITESPRGEHGFGYDPIFYYPDYGKTFAELRADEKNQVSHRAEAIRKLRPLLKKYL
jgi:XTP/dITP diphosphohydrolase